jgi:hypothetical protein
MRKDSDILTFPCYYKHADLSGPSNPEKKPFNTVISELGFWLTLFIRAYRLHQAKAKSKQRPHHVITIRLKCNWNGYAATNGLLHGEGKQELHQTKSND